MLTIQLKVERETANPIKALKRIDLGLRIDTLARLPRRTGGASFLLKGKKAPTWPKLLFLRTFSKEAVVARTNVTDLMS